MEGVVGVRGAEGGVEGMMGVGEGEAGGVMELFDLGTSARVTSSILN